MILLQNMIPTYILFRLFIFRFCVFEDFEHLLSKQKKCVNFCGMGRQTTRVLSRILWYFKSMTHSFSLFTLI